MTELKSYVCPNCGANTTNAQNCEYCGSLLVRFVEKGIDLSHTSYTNNSGVFPGLIEELKRNLKLQEENPRDPVSTDLLRMTEKVFDSINILCGFMWSDNTEATELDSTGRQLCICLGFDTYTDVSSPECKEFNEEQDAQLAKFRQLESFPIFTAHNSVYTDDYGISKYGREYAINFGEDAEGAARLVSEILIKVMGWSPTDPYDMFTNVGVDNIARARDAWKVAHGFAEASNPESTNSGDNSGCLGIIIALIVSITTLCSVFF